MSDIKTVDEFRELWSQANGTAEQPALTTALTFDDILLVPRYSTVLPRQVCYHAGAAEKSSIT